MPRRRRPRRARPNGRGRGRGRTRYSSRMPQTREKMHKAVARVGLRKRELARECRRRGWGHGRQVANRRFYRCDQEGPTTTAAAPRRSARVAARAAAAGQ